MPWLRQLVAGLSPWRPGIVLGSVHVGFVVDKVALGQVFSQVLWFSPVNIIPPLVSILIYYLRDEQWALWWPQFKDIISSHRHKEQQQQVMC
jgi:hypothetical protein